jgi:uncharacterized protein YjbI with pentapeptide repeats
VLIDDAKNDRPKRWPQFSLRAVLVLMMMLAVLLAWRVSLDRAERRLAEQVERTQLQASQLRYAEEELQRARDELRDVGRVKPDRTRAFWQASFDGAQLRGATLASPENAFQRASFNGCQLTGATLRGGGSSFQLARFDDAQLAEAKLTGGNASFQYATFVGADLTGAVLTGGPSSFQKASFERAKLIGSRLSGGGTAFQSANISETHFEGADLSALDADSLSSCYFHQPPSYDAKTKFPTGFDPAARQWRLVSE